METIETESLIPDENDLIQEATVLERKEIASIVIDLDRYREGVGDEGRKSEVAFDDLKGSLQRLGQLQPIKINRNGELIAGYRRLSAALQLGWSHVLVVYDDQNLDELTRREMELEENLHRLDMSWQERQRAIADIDRIRRIKDPSWGQAKTAAVASTSQSKVSEAIQLTEMMKLFPEIGAAKTAKAALSVAKQKAKTIQRSEKIVQNPKVFEEVAKRVVNGDSVDFIKALPDGFCKLILTDPPFGIDYDKRKLSADLEATKYKDDEESYARILTMAPNLYRVLEDDGWLIWFCGMSWYERCKMAFREVGFVVDELPLIWNRSNSRTYTVRPDRYFGRGYDIALHCLKGNPEIVKRGRKGGNVFTYDSVDRSEKEFIVERPIELYEDIIEHLTVKGERVVDFFAGSGSVAAAASRAGRDFLTVEKEADQIPGIITKIQNNTPGGK